jgi:hypothetical protein
VLNVYPENLVGGYEVAIAARDMLYFFELFTHGATVAALYPSDFYGGLHCLSTGPGEDDNTHWSWQPLSCCSPLVWSWSHRVPTFPFDPKTISGHAVHPKMCTIFVSACAHDIFGTFSCANGGRGKWQRIGDWVLPFKGPSHCDQELDAWVGLHLRYGAADGHLCVCPLVSGSQQPNWKLGEEMLFLKHP